MFSHVPLSHAHFKGESREKVKKLFRVLFGVFCG